MESSHVSFVMQIIELMVYQKIKIYIEGAFVCDSFNDINNILKQIDNVNMNNILLWR